MLHIFLHVSIKMFKLADSSFLQITRNSPRGSCSYPGKADVQKPTNISWKSDPYTEVKERRQRGVNSEAPFFQSTDFLTLLVVGKM